MNKHHTFAHHIVTEQKGDNKFAIMQYRRNMDDLKVRYLDKLNERKQKLMNLYSNEEHQLMHEFEEMKRNELVNQYNNQNVIIDHYKDEVANNND